MFQRLLGMWRRLVGGEADTDEDRRVWVRYPSSVETVVQAVKGGDSRLAARVGNVSRGGIRLVINHLFKPGDLISIDLPGGPAELCSTVLACVVHAQPVPGTSGEWGLGCSFLEELSDTELAALGARKQKPAPEDNRTWVRFRCDVTATCQLIEDPDRKSWPARVVNISANGIGLLVDQPVPTGSLLSLNLENTAHHSARTILACVVHSTSRPEHEWALGCNFIRELSESDLKALL
jgi:hypothetical protein